MKVPTPIKMSSGNWFIRMRLDGENFNITDSTKTGCINRARLIKAEYKNGKTLISSSNITLHDAIDKYIEKRSNVLSPSTIRGYRIIQRNRFKSYMNMQISSISNWQSVVNDESKIVSAKTVKNSWGFIKSVLSENGIKTNRIQLPQTVENERPWLTPEQVQVFVDAIKGNEYEIAALLELHSLRRSEMKGLSWENSIDLENDMIMLEGSVVPDEEEKLVYKKTNKNKGSRRIIPIMIPALKDALLAVKDKSGYVVKCHPNTVRKGINRTCKAAGLPLVGNQGLRYSFASLCYHLGLSDREIMELGGWSDMKTMHKIYIRISQEDKKAAAKRFSDFFKNAK